MKEFNISRLNTHLGIIKLKGTTRFDRQTNQRSIMVFNLEIMGSDGWVKLDINHEQTQHMLKRLHNEIIAHLAL